jgi:hypothetical protein
MIEAISRSFGISDRRERSTATDDREAGRVEPARQSQGHRTEKDLFDLARGIAFRARKRRIRSAGII